ncbi:L,D-transpeptidase family protein [Sphingosinicella sp. LHD-64]|uniref:L,D-transpeptidase family protein n=1 Tax=Sphingosinicella sp. LHD-64 TaxID=3072139 RepID=UPI00280CA0A1|nr:L,D-transpeptidase family protein [Sphingosinicella sp. LHD-64]MDQ8755240.1 L,D-transpeptidase family protein [Sphingosinicella sp. LHD-64]
MKFAKLLSLGTVAALLLGAAPVQSSAADGSGDRSVQMHALSETLGAPAAGLQDFVETAQRPVIFADGSDLDPGEFAWRPELAPSGAVEVVVSIPLQRAYVYRSGTLIGVTTVSTGRPGHATPIGRFDILEKRREHYSNLYNNAPMPFMQRLTWDGIALHAGQIPGRPASHGCIRLPMAFARELFQVTRVGATVHILDASPTPDVALIMARGERLASL